MTYNVLDFGAVENGETLCTKAVVRFEEGRYVLSTVFLRSNVTIEIEENATVLGSLNFDEYCPDEKVDRTV